MKRRTSQATDMIDELGASGAHPSLAGKAALFDRFVGAWDLDSVHHATDGKSTSFRGKWIFGWVLDGRLLQDVLIEGDERSGRRLGTTLRFYDAKSEQWRGVWIPPSSGNVIVLKGGAEGDRIVLEGKEPGAVLRWSFNDVQRDSFLWRGETSADGGRTWRVEQEMRLKRAERSGAAAAFERLKSLRGEWNGVQGGTEVTVTYTLTADGSALMEELRPSNQPVMITMFTVDGDRLLATHYCSAGNQPHMATDSIREVPDKRLAFSLVRVTGLTTPEDWHNTGLVMIFEDADHLRQEWTYQYEGKNGERVFHYTRRHEG